MYCIKNSFGIIDRTVQLGPAIWPHFDLIYVHTGLIQLRLKDRPHRIEAGQAILICPQTEFVGHCLSQTAKISVHHFKCNSQDPSFALFEDILTKNNDFILYEHPQKEGIEFDIERIVWLAQQPENKGNAHMRAYLMWLILAQLTSIGAKNDQTEPFNTALKNLTYWLKENLNKNLTLKDMAARTGLSTSHFRMLFKKHYGISPGKYVLTLRLKEAARLLKETLTPIKTIPNLTGFRDAPHFYHIFKKNYGTTPKDYRKQNLLLG